MTHKFKVGDVVARISNEGGETWLSFLDNQASLGDLIITKVSDGGLFIQLNDWSHGTDEYPFACTNFTPVKRVGQVSCLCPTCHQDLRGCDCVKGPSGLLVQHVGQQVDVVKAPSHYQFFPGVEAIEIIAASLTEEGFHGYCMGNRLKYRLRAGNKDKLEQDISKSDFYVELFNKHKHLCREA